MSGTIMQAEMAQQPAFALVAAALGETPFRRAQLAQVPGSVARLLDDPTPPSGSPPGSRAPRGG